MIERFLGKSGKRLFHQALREQFVVNNDREIPTDLLGITTLQFPSETPENLTRRSLQSNEFSETAIVGSMIRGIR